MVLPAAPAFISKTANGALWLGHGAEQSGGVRALGSRVSGGSVPGPEPGSRTGPALLRRRTGALVRHPARGCPELPSGQAPRTQLSARTDPRGGRCAAAGLALAVV